MTLLCEVPLFLHAKIDPTQWALLLSIRANCHLVFFCLFLFFIFLMEAATSAYLKLIIEVLHLLKGVTPD